MVRFVMLVDADGTIHAEVQDAPGEACLDYVDSIRRLAPGAAIVASSTTTQFLTGDIDSQARITEGAHDRDA